MVNAKTFLEKRYSDDIELEDAIHTAILTLKVVTSFSCSGLGVGEWITDAYHYVSSTCSLSYL